jgi:hypothetical protein
VGISERAHTEIRITHSIRPEFRQPLYSKQLAMVLLYPCISSGVLVYPLEIFGVSAIGREAAHTRECVSQVAREGNNVPVVRQAVDARAVAAPGVQYRKIIRKDG